MSKVKLSDELHKIIDAAKWAPSGDNAQPWYIEPISEKSFTLDLTKFQKNTYNHIHIPDYISVGMFIEAASLTASQMGYKLSYLCDESKVEVSIVQKAEEDSALDRELFNHIKTRSVNRLSYKRDKIETDILNSLAQTLDDDMRVNWFFSFKEKLKISQLMMKTTNIRLTIPETYAIHNELVDWSGDDSADRLPYKSIGLSLPSLAMMKWSLKKEKRNKAMMAIPGATFMPALEMDFFPGMNCGAHYILSFDPVKCPEPKVEDYIRAGRSMQKFWLTLDKHKLAMQPWYLIFMFSMYIEKNIKFTQNTKKTEALARRFKEDILMPNNISLNHIFFTGRIGYAIKQPKARSVRKSVESYLEK